MIYMGSKNRIAEELIPIITKYLTEERWYVEPFCGGCNMIDKVNHSKRMANDYNKYLIALFKALQNDIEMPKEISKDEYCNVRDRKDSYPDWYVGYVGFVCSFRGKFFNGYRKNRCATKNGSTRDYQKESTDNIRKQINSLKGIIFSNGSYSDMIIPDNSVIYCDPPYQDTTSYKNADSFDHESFWSWCRYKTNQGCDVLVSEYNAPDDFVCVWSKEISSSLSNNKGKRAVEKLFVHKSIADKYIQRNLFNL